MILKHSNSQMTIFPPTNKTETGHFQKNSASAWKITQDFIQLLTKYT